ncbi:MAG: O-antigen ligase family protein, partial [Desulfobacteraceae bacterium]|nr:O-antigen ligase family protein [Desulfobacteraceae bacterium]
VVFMAGGRGGWINLIVVLTGFGAWMMYRDRKNIFRIAVAGLLLALIIVGALHFSHGFSTRLNQSLLVFSKDTALIDDALGLRLPIWQTAITVFKHHPVNGVGARNLRYVYADFASPDDHFIRTGLTVAHAHTLILDIGSETGLIGLLGLVLVFGMLLGAWRRADFSHHRHMLPYALALSAIFFPLNTHYATYSSAWSAVCFWLLALFCAASGGVAGQSGKTILWWGRCDPEYSRNRLLRSLLKQQGWRIQDFYPGISFLGNLEASLRGISTPDLVWVPCFRHRDLLSARRWSAGHKTPLVFDPLISDYDKQVFERNKFAEDSRRARTLLKKESRLMQAPDLLLADTTEHARFYRDILKADPKRLFVLPVGAEEDLFHPDACNTKKTFNPTTGTDLLEVLFYGSFIPLQGPQFIAEAIRLYQGPPVHWVFLGNGPLLQTCQKMTSGLPHVVFESWLPYLQLPARICRADILLGIFGATPKTRRVIPNKVFQSMACGRPVITAATPAYPESLLESRDSGIIWVEPANPEQLADAVAHLAKDLRECHRTGAAAHQSFHRYFSVSHLSAELEKILATISNVRKNS